MAGVAIYFVIALTLCTVLLLTELRGYQKLRAPVIGVQCAVLASVVFAFSGSYQGRWSLFWNAAPLLIMWQAVLGCAVGMAIASAHVETRPHASAVCCRDRAAGLLRRVGRNEIFPGRD